MFNNPWKALASAGFGLCTTLRGLVIGASLLLAACGGGGGSSAMNTVSGQAACTAASCGSALLTITDATGDFTSYVVDVKALSLKRADGTVVEMLPKTQRIDFAQLVNVSELLTAVAIPRGNYVSGSITLDYTNAAVAVEVGGLSVPATVLNSANANPGVVTLSLQLDTQNQLTVAPGRVAGLALDFNLAASNTVDTTMTPPVVIVKPTILASVVPAQTKDLRVRGTLASVDTTASSYVVNLRPFREAATNSGQVTVLTTTTTSYEINGASHAGAAGLAALAALPAGTITAAFGTLQVSDRSFTALRVLAGTSLEGPNLDGLVGAVIARNGNVLTVRGATLERHDVDDRFMIADVAVTVGNNTAVVRAGDPTASLTSQAISVGQRVVVLGTATTTAGVTSFDATLGRVRLEFTSLWGYFLGGGAGVSNVNLQAIDGRAPASFNFAGTGPSAAQDADPANYEVNTGSLPLSGITVGAPTRYFGFVTAFGAAPPDFDARLLVDFSNTAAELRVDWKSGGTATPFVSATATGIVVDLANANLGRTHTVRTGPQSVDLKTLTGNPGIVPGAATTQLYAIRGDGSNAVATFSSFSAFVTDLNARLTAGAKIEGLWGRGQFNAATDVFTADQLAVELE
jgi:hypothetical protein